MSFPLNEEQPEEFIPLYPSFLYREKEGKKDYYALLCEDKTVHIQRWGNTLRIVRQTFKALHHFEKWTMMKAVEISEADFNQVLTAELLCLNTKRVQDEVKEVCGEFEPQPLSEERKLEMQGLTIKES